MMHDSKQGVEIYKTRKEPQPLDFFYSMYRLGWKKYVRMYKIKFSTGCDADWIQIQPIQEFCCLISQQNQRFSPDV